MINAITAEGIAASSEKAFSDAPAGPGRAPEPGYPPGPERFVRPYLTEGAAADSPANEPEPQRVRLDWRAGTHGAGPIGQAVRNWRPGVTPVSQLPGGGDRP